MATVYPALLKQGHVGFLKAANMNSTADQTITIVRNGQKYTLNGFFVSKASTSLTTAAGGVYTGTSKSGTQVLSSATTYSTINNSTKQLKNIASDSTAGALARSDATLYLSLTTAQGSAATADFGVIGYQYPVATNCFMSNMLAFTLAGSATSGRRSNPVTGTLKTANFNSTSDQPYTVLAHGLGRKLSTWGIVEPTGTFATCAGGFYTGASKSGTTLLSAATTYSTLAPGTTEIITKSGPAAKQTNTTTYFSLTTAEGSAATATIIESSVMGEV